MLINANDPVPPSRCDRGHSVCGRGPTWCRRPGDPNNNVTSAGIMWPRSPTPFVGYHGETPPVGGGAAATERRTKCAATLAHDWQLHIHFLILMCLSVCTCEDLLSHDSFPGTPPGSHLASHTAGVRRPTGLKLKQVVTKKGHRTGCRMLVYQQSDDKKIISDLLTN